MAKRQTLELEAEEKKELETVRDHHSKPYMREKASALLKIAAGATPHAVAVSGLHKPRDPDSIYDWLKRYRAEGIDGLKIKAGRGRKPAFSPSV